MNKRDDIISALQVINRPGIPELIQFLDKESDFFTAPSSTMFHSAYEGGLAEHSWNVFDLLVKKNEYYNLMYEYSTLAICGLLHDACKINFFKYNIEDPTEAQVKYLATLTKGKKLPSVEGPLTKKYVSDLINYYKNGGDLPEYTAGSYSVNDQFPIGHGEKSVIVIQKFIQLEDFEALAIRWHMSAFDPGVHFRYPSGYPFGSAMEKSPLVTILFTADFEASNVIERS